MCLLTLSSLIFFHLDLLFKWCSSRCGHMTNDLLKKFIQLDNKVYFCLPAKTAKLFSLRTFKRVGSGYRNDLCGRWCWVVVSV